MAPLDVESLHGRWATGPLKHMILGGAPDRMTWSRPGKEAIVGWKGAYGDPAFAGLTCQQADEASNRVAHALPAAGPRRSDRVLIYHENSVEAVPTMPVIAKALAAIIGVGSAR